MPELNSVQHGLNCDRIARKALPRMRSNSGIIIKLCILHGDLEEIGITQVEEVEEITVNFIVYGAFDYSDVLNEIGSITFEI